MKKFLYALLSAALAAVFALSLTACGNGNKVKIVNVNLSQEQYGVAVAKGNTALKTQIDEVLTQLVGDGITVDGKKVTFDSLYTAEMEAADNGNLIGIGTVKKSSTDRSKELVVATNAEFAPFEYMVGDSFGGIDMQVAKILAAQLGKELVVLHMQFEAVLEAVGNQVDIGMAGLTINDERKQTVDFSVPYYDTTQQIAVLDSDDTFDGCTTEEEVAAKLASLQNVSAGAAKAQTGYYYMVGNESFEFDGFPNIDTKVYNTIALAVQDLANGKIKLVCGDKDTLTAAVKAINK